MSEKAMVLLLTIVKGDPGVTLTSIPVTAKAVTHVTSNLDRFIQLMGLVFVLIMILIAAYFTTKLVSKVSIGQIRNSNFKVIDTYRISPNKFLQIVKVSNKYVVIAVSKDSVNFVTELEESEVFIKDVNAKENVNFKQILEKMRNKTE